MSKNIILSIVAVFLSFAASAQNSIFDNPDNKPYFGARIGLDISCPGNVNVGDVGIDFFNCGAGLEFGAIYNYPLVANLYIEPGVKLYYDTYSATDIETLTYDFMDALVRQFGLRIPILAGYHFDFTSDIRVSVFTGPEVEVGLYGKEVDKIDRYTVSTNPYSKEGWLHRVNLLWNIGAGVSYRQYYMSIDGAIGMLNMWKTSDWTFHQNRVTISLGYNF
ncbi:MAG: PorT family protein [Bacteroides sp.]|nr:PorT family protein [Bacteroides sp.]MCM1096373.1 PorT family protein [Terasakiella sp.]